jgi:hypothetical protein
MKKLFLFALAIASPIPYAIVKAEERFLLAADNQVIEINRSRKVTDSISGLGHSGIYEAWRLPDGGVAYAHRQGLAVFDAKKTLVLSHAARPGNKGTEANSCAVLDNGACFALMDSGVSQIRVVDRSGNVLSETPLPEIEEGGLHSRYRTIRTVRGEKAFWVAQYGRKTILKVGEGSGKILSTIDLASILKPSPAAHTAFGITALKNGALWVATSTGKQLLRIGASGEVERSWLSEELDLKCRYLLGTQQLDNDHLLVACGDYHLKNPDEGRDLVAEIDSNGKVAWKVTREQLVDQIEGFVDPKTGIEEMRITNIHAYDNEHLEKSLHAVR